MGNLNVMGPECFSKGHHKKGYKELGWLYAKICRRKGEVVMTEPLEDSDPYVPGQVDQAEWIIWLKDDPIAEFKKRNHADFFMDHLTTMGT